MIQPITSSCSNSEVDISTKYLPEGQILHIADPRISAYIPAAQIRQEEDDSAPSFGLYRPLTQLMQVSDDIALPDELYLPFAHKVQRSEPAEENVPAAQASHAAVPVEAAYVPAAHGRHWVAIEWAAGEEAGSAKNVPIAQFEHVALPMESA